MIDRYLDLQGRGPCIGPVSLYKRFYANETTFDPPVYFYYCLYFYKQITYIVYLSFTLRGVKFHIVVINDKILVFIIDDED